MEGMDKKIPEAGAANICCMMCMGWGMLAFAIAAYYKDDAGQNLDDLGDAFDCSEIVFLSQAMIWTGVTVQGLLFLALLCIQVGPEILPLFMCLYSVTTLISAVWSFWAMDDFFTLSSECETIIEDGGSKLLWFWYQFINWAMVAALSLSGCCCLMACCGAVMNK